MAALWNVKARIYDRCRQVYPVSQIWSRELKGLRELMATIKVANPRVLDIGAGTGATAGVWFSRQDHIFLLDKSFRMLSKARANTGIPRCVLADAQALPFKSAVFDLVTVIGVTEYLNDFRILITEVDRVANDRAWAILTYAPRTMANILRLLLGHRLLLLNDAQVLHCLRNSAFVQIERKTTWLQSQLLIKKA
jgi:ubiquinone/menaquinone biosynthesis C-methylase UbiE